MLGPLTAQASDPTEMLFHLGLLLYWRKQNTDAVAQWRQVVQDSPSSIGAARSLADGNLIAAGSS